MQILTTVEVSKLLKIDIRTLQRQAQTGFYPANVCGRVGRKYLFNEEELLKFVFSEDV